MANELVLTGPGAQPGAEPAPTGAALPPRTWEEAFPRRPRPADGAYGFLSARGEPVASSRETLLHVARTRSLPPLVWSPESEEMVPPWEVPFLLEAMRGNVAEAARTERRMVIVGSAVAALLLFAIMPPLLALAAALLVAPLAMVVIGMITRRIEQAEQIAPEALRREFDAVVDLRAEQAQPIPTTHAVGLAIAAVGVSQIFFMDASVNAGAVSRQAVAAGEWWRVFTAPMLHGGMFHFWMNYAALESLGRTMETRGARGYVPVVFVAAALAGGVCSILLPPDTPSVGASGGLMGMFGFLAVMAWRREKHLPNGFLRGLLTNIALIGLVGLIAYRFIDNAAHAGGLLAGLLVGVAAVPGGDEDWSDGPALRLAAGIAHAAIFASAALAIVLTLSVVFG